jgi:ribonuclease T
MNEAEWTAQRLAAARLMARRFRGFLPVVIDVETGGFHAATDALLEIAAVMIEMDLDGTLRRGPTHSFHVKPFEGGRLDPAALSITGIDPHHPLRPALPERDALQRVFREIRHAVRDYNCRRAILVGHNAACDPGGRRPRTDGISQGRDGGWPHVGLEQRALRLLRRGAHGGPVLHHFQPPARQLSRSGGTCPLARMDLGCH